MDNLTTAQQALDACIDLIAEMNREQIQRVIIAVKARNSQLAVLLTMSFKAGDKVMFKGRWGQPATGEVTGTAMKTVKVQASDGTPWRISPQLLTKIK